MPEHPWNQVHRVFYSHTFTNGEVYEHESAFDPPWTNWAPFYSGAQFHAHVVAILDRFLEQSEEQVERQLPVQRAVLLRDLWPVFDAQTNQHLAASAIAARRQATIRERLARVMRRLELSDKEVMQLPDNFRDACERQLFPTEFDATLPNLAFLPPDLLEEDGSWVPFEFRKDQVGALAHVTHDRFRTIVVPLIRVSADRRATLDFLKRYTSSRGKMAPPEGTVLALVRKAVLPSTSGRLLATSVMESLQLIVVDPPHDHRFKFVLDRAALIKGRDALRAVTKDEPIDAYGFESGGLYPREPKYDGDGELLVFGQYAGPASRGMPLLNHCIACHGETVGPRLFANFHTGQVNRAEPTTFEDQISRILSQKKASFSWGMYAALRHARLGLDSPR
jgi:hypothetical protein